jgi:glycosyltransferase involved in cell wall biosynthesis
MALHNGARFLEAAVNSVFAQTYPYWELLIAEDGSTDNSLEAATTLATRDKRVQVLRHPGGCNFGVSATRNLAIRHAKGRYLAILDCDDLWLPSKLEQQVSVLEPYPNVVLTYGKAHVITEMGPLAPGEGQAQDVGNRPSIFGAGLPNEPVSSFARIFSHGMWVPASSAVFSRTSSEACGNFDESLPGQVEDSHLFLRLAERGPIYFMDRVLIRYRLHANQYNARTKAAEKAHNVLVMLIHLAQTAYPENKQQILAEATGNQFRSVASLCLSRNLKLIVLLQTIMKVCKSPEVSPAQRKQLARIVWERIRLLLQRSFTSYRRKV